VSGDHYFSSSPGSDLKPRAIRAVLAGREVEVVTAGGIFSPDHVDTGTAVLLGSVPEPPQAGNVLDLGCGWGPIALTLALKSPHATVWAVDVNERALDLVRANAEKLSMQNIIASRPSDIPADVEFATIWSNPPIRVGKDELHGILDTWLPRLAPGGEAWLVVAKQLGGDSLHRWLETERGWAVTREETSKGFRVLKVTRAN
jgi:16S rRNA G1207 methylase RsmC